MTEHTNRAWRILDRIAQVMYEENIRSIETDERGNIEINLYDKTFWIKIWDGRLCLSRYPDDAEVLLMYPDRSEDLDPEDSTWRQGVQKEGGA